MAVTPDPPRARGLVSGRASRAPSERPHVAHSAPAPDKTVRLIVPIQKLESLTIDATADRDETDRRIVHPLSGRALLDRNSLPRWPANGKREPVAGRCVLTQVARPTKPQARAFFVGGHSEWSVQINSERHIWEIKIIGVKGIYNIFSLIFEFPKKFAIDTISS